VNGAVFTTGFPRTTTFRWNPVSGAVSYSLEVDCYHCCIADHWCSDTGRTWDLREGITGTTTQTGFAGKQKGRWRVWAVDPRGSQGITSPWREFVYTN
jgi:hypothetical protein